MRIIAQKSRVMYELDPNDGTYTVVIDEGDYDYSECPVCHGKDSGNPNHITLKEIKLSDDLLDPLLSLWNDEKEKNAKRKNKIESIRYGIPLSNKKLKGLLVEELI
jgi:hypothetical protein